MTSLLSRASKPTLKVAEQKYALYSKGFYEVFYSINLNDDLSIESKFDDLEDVFSLFINWYEKLYSLRSELGNIADSNLIKAEADVAKRSYQHVREKMSNIESLRAQSPNAPCVFEKTPCVFELSGTICQTSTSTTSITTSSPSAMSPISTSVLGQPVVSYSSTPAYFSSSRSPVVVSSTISSPVRSVPNSSVPTISQIPTLSPIQNASNTLLQNQNVSTDLSFMQYITKNDLLKDSAANSKFDGKMKGKYKIWSDDLRHRMNMVTLTGMEKLRVLYQNTSGHPNQIVDQYYRTAQEETANVVVGYIWDILDTCYGNEIDIIREIEEGFRSFPVIKSEKDIKSTCLLLSILQNLILNLPSHPSLQKLNGRDGFEILYSKIPRELQNKLKKFTLKRRQQLKDLKFYPAVEDCIPILSAHVHEYSDPILSNSLYASKLTHTMCSESEDILSPSKSSAKTLTTSPKKNSGQCPLHTGFSHPLSKCIKFAKLNWEEKSKILKENNRCFNCLGKHLLRGCISDVKCAKCPRRHLTLLHRDPSSLPPPVGFGSSAEDSNDT